MVHWIWLHLCELDRRVAAVLVRDLGGPAAIYGAGAEVLDRYPQLGDRQRQRLLDKDLSRAQGAVEACQRNGWQILTIMDPGYPEKLKKIDDPPLVLFCWGRLPEVDRRLSIGIVGTRNASGYGLRHTRRMAGELAQAGTVVVSGGALGIDTAALEAALEAGSCPIAVVAGGLDKLYPAQNKGLFRAIAQQGCVVTEYLPGTPCQKYQFLARNRLISGLSDGTLVMECPVKSGSMSTARHAQKQLRPVLALPGPVGDGSFSGCHALIRDGAVLVESAEQVQAEFPGKYPAPGAWPVDPGQKAQINVDKRPRAGYIDTHKDRKPPTGELAGQILAVLEGNPLDIAGLARELGTTPIRVELELMTLERDYVRRGIDGRYRVVHD